MFSHDSSTLGAILAAPPARSACGHAASALSSFLGPTPLAAIRLLGLLSGAAEGPALLARALRWCRAASASGAAKMQALRTPLAARFRCAAADRFRRASQPRCRHSCARRPLTRTRLPRAAWRRRSVPLRPPLAGAVAASLLRAGRSGAPRRRAPGMRACRVALLRHTALPSGVRARALINARSFAGRALACLARWRCVSSQVRSAAALRAPPAQHARQPADAPAVSTLVPACRRGDDRAQAVTSGARRHAVRHQGARCGMRRLPHHAHQAALQASHARPLARSGAGCGCLRCNHRGCGGQGACPHAPARVCVRAVAA